MTLLISLPYDRIHSRSVSASKYKEYQMDTLCVISLKDLTAGCSGSTCKWDFSNISITEDTTYIVSLIDSMGNMCIQNGKARGYYDRSNDTLKLVRKESALTNLHYTYPQVKLCYPFEYGDSVYSIFYGEGTYCRNHYMRENGFILSKADAKGIIVTPEKDTLTNVIRLYTLRSYTLCMDMDTLALDTAKQKLIIEEEFEWYAQGIKYPIFALTMSSSYADMTPVGTTRTSYCHIPIKPSSNNDSIHVNMQSDEYNTLSDKSNIEQELINYTAKIEGTRLIINYNIEEDADITAIVASSTGLSYKVKQWKQTAGRGYREEMDCSGLRPGAYILYINVNGRIYSNTITI